MTTLGGASARAADLLALGRAEEALRTARTVLAEQPDHVRAPGVAAQAAWELDDLAEALRVAHLLVAAAPQDDEALALAAEVARAASRPTLARRSTVDRKARVVLRRP